MRNAILGNNLKANPPQKDPTPAKGPGNEVVGKKSGTIIKKTKQINKHTIE